MKANIEKLIKRSKPDTKFDKHFAKELRAQLVGKESSQTSMEGFLDSIINLFKYMTNVYKYAGAVGVAVIVIAVGIYTTQTGDVKLAFAPEINKVGAGAFGSLLAQDGKADTSEERAGLDEAMNESEASMLGTDMAKSVASSIAVPAPGIGAGGGGGTPPVASAEGGGMASSEMAVDAKMIAPYPYNNFTYKYVGDEFTLEDTTVSVMRRLTGSKAGDAIVNQVKSINWGLLDLGSFNSALMENISFKEDRDFGYYVNVNFNDGSINISENWMKWPNQWQICENDRECVDRMKLTINDMPTDDELISIANKFLDEYGISKDAYGKAEVNQDWKQWYDQAIARGDSGYIPDQVQVKYPLLVNSEIVHDQGGNSTGLNVNVNVRHKKAAGVWNLRSQSYESSDYEAITSIEDIIALVEKGGEGYYFEGTEESKELQIGSPERILMATYTYTNNQSNELLVPALKFPITNLDEDMQYYRKHIIVPLAKELFEQQLPKPRPEPRDDVIIMERAEEALSGSNEGVPEGADVIEVNE